MKKAFVSTVTALVMACSLGACAGKQEAAAPAEPEQEAAATATATEEDGQNPIMNFIGNYGYERATMEVSALGMEKSGITVWWSSSAAEHYEWTMTGVLDADALTLEYTDCVKKDVVFNEAGEIVSETVLYENGTGTVRFFMDGHVEWEDAMEHAADGAVFEWIPVIP